MKFSRTPQEPRQPRPRRAAEALDPRIDEDASTDIRQEIVFRLKHKWDAYVNDLYEECVEGRAEKSDLYQYTALLRQLTINAGGEWVPPQEWKPAFIARARERAMEMHRTFNSHERLSTHSSSLNSYADIELQGILQTFPEIRFEVPLPTKGIMCLSRDIIGILREHPMLAEMAIPREYAMVVLQPKNATFVQNKNSGAGFTPQTLFENMCKRVPVPAFFLAQLRLLYPKKQEDILKLWTSDLQQRTEEEFSNSTAQASVEMQHAFALMVLQAQDARLVDGQVVLQFAPPTLRKQTPLPPHSHI